MEQMPTRSQRVAPPLVQITQTQSRQCLASESRRRRAGIDMLHADAAGAVVGSEQADFGLVGSAEFGRCGWVLNVGRGENGVVVVRFGGLV